MTLKRLAGNQMSEGAESRVGVQATAEAERIVEYVRARLSDMDFGRISFVINRGQVVEVEATDRIRLPTLPNGSQSFR